MALGILLAIQAAAPAPAPSLVPVEFDLGKVKPSDPCAGGATSEIVVCGRRVGQGDYDLEAWEKVFRDKPLIAEIGVGGGATARAYVESAPMPQGQVSKRVMIGIKMGF